LQLQNCALFQGSGGVAERLKAADCKSVLSEYVGSNPASSTILKIILRRNTKNNLKVLKMLAIVG
jgi:hypothetical protein